MSREIVIHGSAAAPWVLPDERTEHSERLLEQVVDDSHALVVPELWRYEMLNVLRTGVLSGRITEEQARKGLARIGSIPLELVPTEAQGQGGILDTALSMRLTAYDATYLHLARSRGLDLVTADRELLALRDRFPWIYSVEDFVGH
ncbi:MAG: type II toxin-antitoxin system VapC family toxin [Planctomycetes bacterium]|nr:type II toxin-antitoxin system VapC family toxin [Planctomycetota bacterium]